MLFFFFFKQKTAYEMRISDWSSDVCSSDLLEARWADSAATTLVTDAAGIVVMSSDPRWRFRSLRPIAAETQRRLRATRSYGEARLQPLPIRRTGGDLRIGDDIFRQADERVSLPGSTLRSEEHTSELQSLMRNSYAVFCLKK